MAIDQILLGLIVLSAVVIAPFGAVTILALIWAPSSRKTRGRRAV